MEKLSRIDPVGYGQSRNDLDGAVTRLSPFLRHGVLSLAEVRDAGLAKAGATGGCTKFLQELAWRDYYQRLWRLLGDRIWSDIEPYKTGFDAATYSDELPADLPTASTGIDYIDHFVRELHETGYLHNHARMWLAAYVVHGRRVKWQAGARWFLSHLLDGDEASNNLSWQWCASTFSHKPYIFNRENVLKYSARRFAEHQATDPFDSDYETLQLNLFREPGDLTQPKPRLDLRAEPDPPASPAAIEIDPDRTLVWVHDGMMSPAHPAVAFGKTHLFIWDDQQIAARRYSDARISFQRSALFCPDLHSQGRLIPELLVDIAQQGRFQAIITGDTPDPRLLRYFEEIKKAIEIHLIPDRPFLELNTRLDLTRFSRYWVKAQTALLK